MVPILSWCAISACVLGMMSGANSTPLYSSCPTSDVGNNYSNFLQDDDEVNIYLEDTFATDYSFCSPTDDINSWQAQTIVQASAETWNRESRGARFRYRGTRTYSTETSFCNDSSIEEPAVFILMDRGCKTAGSTALATTDFIGASTCGRRASITVWGFPSAACTANAQCSLNGSVDLPRISDSSTNYDLLAMMIHEFGHVVGLDHASTADPAVMDSGAPDGYSFANLQTRRHLFPYDMDCAVDVSNERESQYHWAEHVAVWGSFLSVDNSPTRLTSKASLSGNHTRMDGSNQKWGAYQQIQSNHPCVAYDYIASYQSPFDFTYQKCDLESDWVDKLHLAPVLYAPLERSLGTGNNSRMSFAQYEETMPTDFDDIDPPRWSYLRSDTRFEDSGTVKGSWYVCTTSASGCTSTSSSERLQTHIPVVSAWDPRSGETMFVSVETKRAQVVNNGRLRIHAGMLSTTNNRIRRGSRLTSSGQDVQSSGTYPYNLETDTIPAVACAGQGESDYLTDFNCILAWVDRGAPNGRILYTYFRHDTNETDRIEWQGQVRRLPGTNVNSVSGVSAMFSMNQFFLAFKTMDSSPDIKIVKRARSSSYFSGWSTINIYRGDVQDPPAWLYSNTSGGGPIGTPDNDAVLFWTEPAL